MPTLKYAAFFRNLNLGRPNKPTKDQLEAAFTTAGASFAQSIITTGNVVFTARSETAARKVLVKAGHTLKSVCGFEEPAHLRSVPYLAQLVVADPFATAARVDAYELCVSFLQADTLVHPVPLNSPRQDLEIFRVTRSEAFSVVRLINNRPGNPTALLEKLLKTPVTTRNWSTVVRIVEKHA